MARAKNLTPHHDALAKLAGRWKGTAATWFEPAAKPEKAELTAQGRVLLDGRFARLDYRSRVMGKPHAGSFLFGFDTTTKLPVAAWIDGFHNGTTIMDCRGDRPPARGRYSVLGSYPDGQGGRWGWRTEVKPKQDTLVIRAFNIPPGQPEARAIEIRLRRA